MKSFTQYLTEIGDSRKGYPYVIKRSSRWIRALFVSDSGLHYTAIFNYNPKRSELDVSFETKEKKLHATNSGLSEALTVMATVVAATKEVIEYLRSVLRESVDYIIFEPSGWNKVSDGGRKSLTKTDRQREKLYLAFIKKELKPAMIIDKGSYIKLDIKKK